VQIGRTRFSVEIAATDSARRTGLMFRQEVPADTGMLFVFEKPQILTFWMQNTYVSLDIAFIDENLVIINTATMPAQSRRLFRSAGKALLALEVPAGTFKRQQIEAGQKVAVGPKVLKLLGRLSDY